jgi:hypothetical protein
MSDITKTMLSCEDKAGAIANDFLNMGKSLQQMGLMDRIRAEVVLLNDIATAGIRIELEKKQPNAAQIIKELKMSIADGYKGLSINLSNEITNF